MATGPWAKKNPSAFTLALEASRDQAPVKTACRFCSWTYSGTAITGREKAREHRRTKHPSAPERISFQGKNRMVRHRFKRTAGA